MCRNYQFYFHLDQACIMFNQVAFNLNKKFYTLTIINWCTTIIMNRIIIRVVYRLIIFFYLSNKIMRSQRDEIWSRDEKVTIISDTSLTPIDVGITSPRHEILRSKFVVTGEYTLPPLSNSRPSKNYCNGFKRDVNWGKNRRDALLT